jgi:hypothetical protein
VTLGPGNAFLEADDLDTPNELDMNIRRASANFSHPLGPSKARTFSIAASLSVIVISPNPILSYNSNRASSWPYFFTSYYYLDISSGFGLTRGINVIDTFVIRIRNIKRAHKFIPTGCKSSASPAFQF